VSPSQLSLLCGRQLDVTATCTISLGQGCPAPGNLTLRTGALRGGKATLWSVLPQQLRAGATVAGQPFRPGKASVVSDEPPSELLPEETARKRTRAQIPDGGPADCPRISAATRW
jgi:hypothetical protein